MPVSADRSFLRLFKLLRPWWGLIFLGALLVIIAAPCELFPAVVWKFITDVVVLKQRESHWMVTWFSLGGRVGGRFGLLISSVVWLFVVYLVGETLETLEGYILNRSAETLSSAFATPFIANCKAKAWRIYRASAPAI